MSEPDKTAETTEAGPKSLDLIYKMTDTRGLVTYVRKPEEGKKAVGAIYLTSKMFADPANPPAELTIVAVGLLEEIPVSTAESKKAAKEAEKKARAEAREKERAEAKAKKEAEKAEKAKAAAEKKAAEAKEKAEKVAAAAAEKAAKAKEEAEKAAAAVAADVAQNPPAEGSTPQVETASSVVEEKPAEKPAETGKKGKK